jgi:hypothetical protein
LTIISSPFSLKEFGLTLADCQKFYGGNGFMSAWKCLVTAHKAAPNAPLREDQEENRVMKGPREPIEHSFGQVTRLWNLSLTGKKLFKLGLGFVVCLVPALAF